MRSRAAIVAALVACSAIVGVVAFVAASRPAQEEISSSIAARTTGPIAEVVSLGGPDEFVAAEWLSEPRAATFEYWQQKPPLAEMIGLSLSPRLSTTRRRQAEDLKVGLFSPYRHYEWLSVGVPPPWDKNPANSPTYDLWQQTLVWIEPLVAQWLVEDDAESLALIKQIVRDWQEHNSIPPGASQYAWNDHAIAERLDHFCWLWELYRQNDDNDETFARLLLEMIYAHAASIDSGATYRGESNHGLMQNVALLHAAAILPEFKAAADWHATVAERMRAYIEDNFSAEGFHLEQAPSYHGFVAAQIGSIVRFLRVNSLPAMPQVEADARRVASVMPYLRRPDRHYVGVGDSWDVSPRDLENDWQRWFGDDLPHPAASTSPNPRNTPGEFVLSFDAGYAIFTAYDIDDPQPAYDTHMFFKCNAFPYVHNHVDALSFVLYGLGHDWLIDSGVHSHDNVPERHYVISARAHNLVLVDDSNSPLGEVELIDHARTVEGDIVTARHHLPQATHTRSMRFMPPYAVHVKDTLQATDGRQHEFAQVFHIDARHELRVVSDRRVEILAADGARCVLEQTADAGKWQIITGQEEPYWQGWFSPGYNELEPSPALYYRLTAPCQSATFTTEIQLFAPPE